MTTAQNHRGDHDVEALHTACDRLVASAPDPAAARALLLRMWALGAAAADDLLADLRRLAVQHAERTDTEASLTELLHALGHHQAAAAHHHAVSTALDEYAGAHADPHEGDQGGADDQTVGNPGVTGRDAKPTHPRRPNGLPHHHTTTGGSNTGAGKPTPAARAAARIHETLQNRRPTPQ